VKDKMQRKRWWGEGNCGSKTTMQKEMMVEIILKYYKYIIAHKIFC
jgi:hypothetical protein